MRSLFCFALMLSFLAYFPSGQAQSDWELTHEKDGIQMYYRWLNLGDTMRTREMRVLFEVEAEPAQLAQLFQDPEQFSAWAMGVKECSIFDLSTTGWMNYTLFRAPWPFREKDLVTRYRVEQNGEQLVFRLTATPDQRPKRAKVSRLEHYEGSWIFSPAENGRTKVVYQVLAPVKPPVPRFMLDPVIQKMYINSFRTFRSLAEE